MDSATLQVLPVPAGAISQPVTAVRDEEGVEYEECDVTEDIGAKGEGPVRTSGTSGARGASRKTSTSALCAYLPVLISIVCLGLTCALLVRYFSALVEIMDSVPLAILAVGGGVVMLLLSLCLCRGVSVSRSANPYARITDSTMNGTEDRPMETGAVTPMPRVKGRRLRACGNWACSLFSLTLLFFLCWYALFVPPSIMQRPANIPPLVLLASQDVPNMVTIQYMTYQKMDPCIDVMHLDTGTDTEWVSVCGTSRRGHLHSVTLTAETYTFKYRIPDFAHGEERTVVIPPTIDLFDNPSFWDECTHFLWFSDTQNGGEDVDSAVTVAQQEIEYRTAAGTLPTEVRGYQAVLHTGDLTDQGTDPLSWVSELTTMSRITRGEMPLIVTVGNHDSGHKYRPPGNVIPPPDWGANF
ncbi:hypothetical protein KIPB_003939, partial [Kipferlia bialata]|eukprot:g3939.t1